jgi:hypothetical protein
VTFWRFGVVGGQVAVVVPERGEVGGLDQNTPISQL